MSEYTVDARELTALARRAHRARNAVSDGAFRVRQHHAILLEVVAGGFAARPRRVTIRRK